MKNFDLHNITEIKLIYLSKVKASDRPKINCSKDAYDLLLSMWNAGTIEHVEEFKILLLNRANSVLGLFPISKGGIRGTVTDVRVVLQAALKANASGLIVAHNHPSGNLYPSDADSRITQRIKEAGSIMEIQLLDHLIIAPEEGYYSFADNGNI
jgi:DNA repair protein RadC